MRIIFLDVDGVLNSTRSFCGTRTRRGLTREEWNVAVIDPIAIGLVNRVLKEHDLRVVVSSTHKQRFLKPETEYVELPDGRAGMMRNQCDLPAMAEYFGKLGVIPDRVIGWTPDLHVAGRVRGDEIQHYLDSHPEVEAYAILDDSADMLEEQLPFFARCDSNDGLTFAAFQQLENIFGGKKPKIVIPAEQHA